MRPRIIFENASVIEHEMRFLIETLLEILAAEMNQSRTRLYKQTEALQSLPCSNAEQCGRLAEISGRILWGMIEFGVRSKHWREVVVKPHSNGKRGFVDLVQVHA